MNAKKAASGNSIPICPSMTGFARASKQYDSGTITVEVRAVNSRYLDTVVRIPRELAEFEPSLKKTVGKHCKRGRVEVTLAIEPLPGSVMNLSVADGRFTAYLAEAEKLFESHGLWSDEVKQRIATEVLIRRDIFSENSSESAVDEKLCVSILSEALTRLRKVQEKEGAELVADMQMRMSNVSTLIDGIQQIHEGQKEKYLETNREKLKDLLESKALPEERLIAEVALMSERTDISEEIIRMKSHLERFGELLHESPCGRKIDFLLQECVREVNTIASKIQNADAQHKVVEAKAEVERVKEQVQNLE